MTVSWRVPSGAVDQYEVQLKEKSGSKRIIKQKSTTSTTFNGLTPGTHYTVVLVTVYGSQRSNTSEKSFYTSKCILIVIKFFHSIIANKIVYKIGNFNATPLLLWPILCFVNLYRSSPMHGEVTTFNSLAIFIINWTYCILIIIRYHFLPSPAT